jgi:hypothetical protein
MSKTDSTRPYWVKLNQDGTLTDHDHTRFGEVVKKRIYRYQENGTPIYETGKYFMSANNVLAENAWRRVGVPGRIWRSEVEFFYDLSENEFSRKFTEPIIRQAHKLVDQGRGGEAIIHVGDYRHRVYDEVVLFTVADYCTEGEKIDCREHSWRGPLPCTPDLPHRRYGTYWENPPGLREFERNEKRSEKSRVNRSLDRAARAYNGGGDVWDYDQDQHMRQSFRRDSAWYY